MSYKDRPELLGLLSLDQRCLWGYLADPSSTYKEITEEMEPRLVTVVPRKRKGDSGQKLNKRG